MQPSHREKTKKNKNTGTLESHSMSNEQSALDCFVSANNAGIVVGPGTAINKVIDR